MPLFSFVLFPPHVVSFPKQHFSERYLPVQELISEIVFSDVPQLGPFSEAVSFSLCRGLCSENGVDFMLDGVDSLSQS